MIETTAPANHSSPEQKLWASVLLLAVRDYVHCNRNTLQYQTAAAFFHDPSSRHHRDYVANAAGVHPETIDRWLRQTKWVKDKKRSEKSE